MAVRLEDDTVAVRSTVPMKPPRLEMLRVEVPLKPDAKLTVAGLAVMLKSGTLTVNVTFWERDPIVAAIVTV